MLLSSEREGLLVEAPGNGLQRAGGGRKGGVRGRGGGRMTSLDEEALLWAAAVLCHLLSQKGAKAERNGELSAAEVYCNIQG